MTIIDRMLFISFLRAFIICLTSTLSLYIIVDLFTNIDSFANRSKGVVSFIQNVLSFYGYRLFEYYDRLSEAISLLAGMFTVAWMQRNNELLPLLSAGVSTKRVLRPILIGSCLLLSLGSFNQEWFIPQFSAELMKDRDDPEGERDLFVQGAFDANGVQIEGLLGNRKEQTVKFLYVTVPETPRSGMVHLSAATAQYIPPGKDKLSGGWLLLGTTPAELGEGNKPEMVVPLEKGQYFVYTKTVDFETITRHPKWFMYASTSKLHRLLDNSDGRRQNSLAVLFHMRLTRPLVGFILVVMGLAIILRDQTRHVFISAGLCLGTCAMFYGVIFACRFLGNADYLPPALAAWTPVLIFGPLAFTLFDAIHT